MTEAESEVELGAAEEENTREAAPKGLEIPLSPLRHPERPPRRRQLCWRCTWIFKYLPNSNCILAVLWNAWRTSQYSSYPTVLSHARIVQRFRQLRRLPPTIQYSSHAGWLAFTETRSPAIILRTSVER